MQCLHKNILSRSLALDRIVRIVFDWQWLHAARRTQYNDIRRLESAAFSSITPFISHSFYDCGRTTTSIHAKRYFHVYFIELKHEKLQPKREHGTDAANRANKRIKRGTFALIKADEEVEDRKKAETKNHKNHHHPQN